MRFFEYIDGKINTLIYPMTSRPFNKDTCFLVYANDEKEAEKIVKEHLDGKPLTTLCNHRWSHDTTYKIIENVAVATDNV